MTWLQDVYDSLTAPIQIMIDSLAKSEDFVPNRKDDISLDRHLTAILDLMHDRLIKDRPLLGAGVRNERTGHVDTVRHWKMEPS